MRKNIYEQNAFSAGRAMIACLQAPSAPYAILRLPGCEQAKETLGHGMSQLSVMTEIDVYTPVRKGLPIVSMSNTEDPFVMVRSLLVLAVIELIVTLGFYIYLS